MLILVIAGKFLMVIGGDRGTYERDIADHINNIEVVSFDPDNATVPECLQNFNPLPVPSIVGCVIRF